MTCIPLEVDDERKEDVDSGCLVMGFIIGGRTFCDTCPGVERVVIIPTPRVDVDIGVGVGVGAGACIEEDDEEDEEMPVTSVPIMVLS